MEKKTDIEIVRDAIELFVVQHFETIEMAGTVKTQKLENVNYFSIDLSNLEWDQDVDKLHLAITTYLKAWTQRNRTSFSNWISISLLTIEYLIPERDGMLQNKSRNIKLFYFPSYYYKSKNKGDRKVYPSVVIKILMFWRSVILRNIVLMAILTGILIILGIYKIQTDCQFKEGLTKSYDYINTASGIIASFVLGFLINKVTIIRQDKLKHTRAIRNLSNRLTYFRSVCYNLARDHNFWSPDNQYYESYQYANSIKHDITFEEYYYPNRDDTAEYAKYRSFYKEELSHNVIALVLQLHLMADDNFVDSGLSYTEFPKNYIYTMEEMDRFILFCEFNLIWYCSSELKIFPESFQNSYYPKEIIKDVNRIYPNETIETLTTSRLKEVSLDFQYRLLPRLYHLTKIATSDLPLTLNYFLVTFILLLIFGLIIPTLTYLFIDKNYAMMSVFIVIGIIGHILLSLKSILTAENTLNRKYDYL